MFRLLVLLLVGTTSIDATAGEFSVKIPLTSIHWGDSKTDYSFNDRNYGIGIKWSEDDRRSPFWGEFNRSFSFTAFRDSFHCNSVNAQFRLTKRMFQNIHVGGALNMTHKCFDSDTAARLKMVPTAVLMFSVSEKTNFTIDIAPAVSEINEIGFAGLTFEFVL